MKLEDSVNRPLILDEPGIAIAQSNQQLKMEAKSSNLSVLLEEGVKRGRVKMDFETEIRFGLDVRKIMIISTNRRIF